MKWPAKKKFFNGIKNVYKKFVIIFVCVSMTHVLKIFNFLVILIRLEFLVKKCAEIKIFF